MPLKIEHSPTPILSPNKDVPWAETMVTNPGIIKDPNSNRIHMLFRACGPWADKTPPGGIYPPYLWVLGYAYSDDLGVTWQIDFSKPAMMPALNNTPETISTLNINGDRVVDYANAYIEDPRFFTLEGKIYVSVCTRMFPVGPYWLDPDGTATWKIPFTPEWARKPDNPFGRGVVSSGNVLYQVNIDNMRKMDYKKSFTVVTHLTNPEMGDNRDVFLFPEKMLIDGKKQYLLIHRPVEPNLYMGIGKDMSCPSIFLAAAERFEDFHGSKAKQSFLAEPIFDWESKKIGGSFPPIRISENEWLLSYHARHQTLGYTQSFMILREKHDSLPVVVHRCPERLMFASMDWEQPRLFPLPCVFSTGGIVIDDMLIISYGAADEFAGIARVNIHELVKHIRRFDATGR